MIEGTELSGFEEGGGNPTKSGVLYMSYMPFVYYKRSCMESVCAR
jgi:hypothetical protein